MVAGGVGLRWAKVQSGASPESRGVTTEIVLRLRTSRASGKSLRRGRQKGWGQSDRQGTSGAGAEASWLPQRWTDLRSDRPVTTRHTTEVGRQLCSAEAQGHQQRLWCLSEARQGLEKGMW